MLLVNAHRATLNSTDDYTHSKNKNSSPLNYITQYIIITIIIRAFIHVGIGR